MAIKILAKTEKLEAARKEKGLSQKAFAEKIEINRTWYNQVEGGKEGVSEETATKICEELGKDFNEIFEIRTKHEKLKNTFGKKLREIRKNKDKTLEEVSNEAGISPSYLSEIERGKKIDPEGKIIKEVAKTLDVDLDQIIQPPGKTTNKKIHDIKLGAAKKEVDSEMLENETVWLLVDVLSNQEIDKEIRLIIEDIIYSNIKKLEDLGIKASEENKYQRDD